MEYTKLSLDVPTYSKLDELAKQKGCSKAAYVRQFVNEQSRGESDDPIVTWRNGRPVRMSQLSTIEEAYTKAMVKLGRPSNTGMREKYTEAVESIQRLAEVALTALRDAAELEDKPEH